MLQECDFEILSDSICTELGLVKDTLTCQNITNVYYDKKKVYKASYIAIDGHDACYMYSKVKKSKALEKFEVEHKANLVLTALQGRYILAINF